jgi:hypothetical protein
LHRLPIGKRIEAGGPWCEGICESRSTDNWRDSGAHPDHPRGTFCQTQCAGRKSGADARGAGPHGGTGGRQQRECVVHVFSIDDGRGNGPVVHASESSSMPIADVAIWLSASGAISADTPWYHKARIRSFGGKAKFGNPFSKGQGAPETFGNDDDDGQMQPYGW